MNRHLVFALALSLGLTGTSATQDRNRDIVKQVVEAWNQRFKAFNGIRFKAEGTTLIPRGSLTRDSQYNHPSVRKDFPPKDLMKPVAVELVIDIKNKRIRKESHYEQLYAHTGKFEPLHDLFLFQDKQLKSIDFKKDPEGGEPKLGETTSIIHYKDPVNPSFLSRYSYPYLFAIGQIPRYDRVVNAFHLFEQTNLPTSFTYYQEGKIGDHTCTILRSVPEGGIGAKFDEYWVDRRRGSIILRWRTYHKAKAYTNLEIAYQQINSYWFPSSWKLDFFPEMDKAEKWIQSEQLKMAEIEVNPKLDTDMFQAQLKHGMLVYDHFHPARNADNRLAKEGLYVVGSDDNTLIPYGMSTQVKYWEKLIVAFMICIVFTLIFALIKWKIIYFQKK